MATISITIPDNNLNDVIDAICDAYGWTADSGLTKAKFAKRVVADFVKEIYRSQVGTKAADSARVSAEAQAKAVDIN
jgi:hypothetical protein